MPVCHMQGNKIFHVALLHRYFCQSGPSGMIFGLETNNGPNVYPDDILVTFCTFHALLISSVYLHSKEILKF